MNKRITSIVLSFVMLFTMLATAVPVLAAGSTSFKMTADKTEAHPGDIITYTVTMGAVTNLDSLKIKLDIPAGLTFVTGSGKITEGLATTMNVDGAEFTESTMVILIGNAKAQDGYTSTLDTEIMKFQCKVDAEASGNKTVNFIIDEDEVFEAPSGGYDNIAFTTSVATVNVTAAPKPATGISLNKSTLELTVGESETLVATVTPADTTDTVTWDTGRSDIATVDSTGKVTAVAPGTAVIAARAGEKSAFCTVTVVAAPCTHTNKTNVGEKPSTCKEQGWEAYSKCNDCGQLFDKDGSEISAIPYRSLADHTPVQTATTEYLKSAATCTAKAVYYEHCSVCDQQLSTTFEYGEPNGHTEGTEWKSDETGHWHVCTAAGCGVVIEGSKTAHTPDRDEATETDPIKCEVCGYVITPALGHNHDVDTTHFESDETNHWNTCSGCSEKQNVSAHEFEWKIDLEATETVNGSKHEECKVCGYKKASVEIPATGTTTDPADPQAPQTGDNGMIGLWIALLFITGTGMVGITVFSRTRRSTR